MTNGSRDDAEHLKEQAATVLAGLMLRFSDAKTRITHLSEGIDFLGFHIPGDLRQLCQLFDTRTVD